MPARGKVNAYTVLYTYVCACAYFRMVGVYKNHTLAISFYISLIMQTSRSIAHMVDPRCPCCSRYPEGFVYTVLPASTYVAMHANIAWWERLGTVPGVHAYVEALASPQTYARAAAARAHPVEHGTCTGSGRPRIGWW